MGVNYIFYIRKEMVVWLRKKRVFRNTELLYGEGFNITEHESQTPMGKELGAMYLSDVTADDIRLALIPLTTKAAGLYSTVNMLIKCVSYSAERSQLLDYNPCVGISAKGGKQSKKKEALTDEQTKLLLDTVKGLPPYTFIMIALYSGLRREEILGLQWDCVFLDVPTPYISVRRAWRTEHNRPVVSTTLLRK